MLSRCHAGALYFSRNTYSGIFEMNRMFIIWVVSTFGGFYCPSVHRRRWIFDPEDPDVRDVALIVKRRGLSHKERGESPPHPPPQLLLIRHVSCPRRMPTGLHFFFSRFPRVFEIVALSKYSFLEFFRRFSIAVDFLFLPLVRQLRKGCLVVLVEFLLDRAGLFSMALRALAWISPASVIQRLGWPSSCIGDCFHASSFLLDRAGLFSMAQRALVWISPASIMD